MIEKIDSITFGPVPSRRLGRSLGINNIPLKCCTYSCIYCQLGRTKNMQIERQQFYTPEKIVNAVKNKVRKAKEKGESIDYLTFVPDGEPTLDLNLGNELYLLKKLKIKRAVITNGSLIWMDKARQDLNNADWVSIKVDTVSEHLWHKINRPHYSLKLNKILDAVLEFSQSFNGLLTTETMLVKKVNDDAKELKKIAEFIKDLNVEKSYVSTPIRPPCENWVEPASDFEIKQAHQIIQEYGIGVEYLVSYEGRNFSYTGNMDEDILSISSVHPVREEGLIELLKKANADWSLIEKLLNEDKLMEVEYNNKKFYVRKLPKKML